MRQPHVDDVVRLTRDVPEFALNRGQVGVVQSTWFAPAVAYEVEFRQHGHAQMMRCLLRPEQVEVEENHAVRLLEQVNFRRGTPS